VSTDTQTAPATVGRACHVCSNPLVDGGKFCPFCGLQTLDVSTISSIQACMQTKVDQEVGKKFTDQNSSSVRLATKLKRMRELTSKSIFVVEHCAHLTLQSREFSRRLCYATLAEI
jgi:hypothetical protein